MPRQRDPDRREDEGRMSVFVTALALVAMVAVAAALAYYLNTAPWAQGFWEAVR